MCQRATCSQCGKPTYSGCGRHVEAVLGDVPLEARCQCRERKQEAGGSASEPTIRQLKNLVRNLWRAS